MVVAQGDQLWFEHLLFGEQKIEDLICLGSKVESRGNLRKGDSQSHSVVLSAGVPMLVSLTA